MAPAPQGSGTSVTEESAIQAYLTGRELAPIEGIWNWSDNAYQVVITKNNTGIGTEYEYVGIIIRANKGGWRAGQVKLLLDETASSTVFTGRYYAGNQTPVGTTYILSNPNLIETSPPVGPYGMPLQQLLIRTYPKDGAKAAGTRPPSEGMASGGTCFVASPDGIVITSHHVIDGASDIDIRLMTGSVYAAEVLHASRANDIAILKIPVSGSSFLPLAKPRTTRAGDLVFTVGFPNSSVLGNQPKFTEGSVSAMSGLMDEPTYMQMSIPVQPGNSGGPVVNERGEVVGIVAATAAVESFYRETGSLPQNVNWAVKAEYAQLLFDLPPALPLSEGRRAAIDRTQNAICQVSASN
ncbi:MAG: serine protease [Gammaproteobacteria bacterium]|nr:serine protease [Gammaproteobacteria bacterium]